MYIFYPIIIVLGFFTSYTDITSRKIRNKHLLFAAILGLFVYAYLAIVRDSFLNLDLILNVLLGTGMGLLLYFTNTWGAGDAKLFAVFCLLMPTEKYAHIFPFASIVIFSNTFLLGILVMLLFSITDFVQGKTQLSTLFKSIFSMSTVDRLLKSLLIVVCLGWIVPPLISAIFPAISGLPFVIILYFCYHIIRKVLGHIITNHYIALLIAIFGLLARFYFQHIESFGPNALASIKITLYYTIIFHCLHTILTSNDEKKNTVPFAPIIFLGTLLTNTNFLNSILHILKTLR